MKKLLLFLSLTVLFACEKEVITEDFVLESRAVSDNPCINTNAFPQLLDVRNAVTIDVGDIQAEPIGVTYKVKGSNEYTSYDWCVVANGEVIIQKYDKQTICVPYVLFVQYEDITVYAQDTDTYFWGVSEKSLCELLETC